MQISIQSLTCSRPTDVFVFSKLYLMLQLSGRRNKFQVSTFACLPTGQWQLCYNRKHQSENNPFLVLLIQFPFISSCSLTLLLTQKFLQNVCIKEDKIIIRKDGFFIIKWSHGRTKDCRTKGFSTDCSPQYTTNSCWAVGLGLLPSDGAPSLGKACNSNRQNPHVITANSSGNHLHFNYISRFSTYSIFSQPNKLQSTIN